MTIQDRAYYTFYGIDTDDKEYTYGTLSNKKTRLVENYISEDASTTTNCTWTSEGTTFLYPHNIAKTYYLEGVIEGHLTFTSEGSGATSYVSDYRVNVLKISSAASETIIATTGIISVNDEIVWNSGTSTGEYKVYPFWIDVFDPAQEITENERIAIRITWDIDNSSTVTAFLSHENWEQGEDVKITFPFLI